MHKTPIRWGIGNGKCTGLTNLGYLMQALGLLTSDAGCASFISMFTVIVVPLIDGMLGAEVPARIWFGAIISILGVGMLESSGSPPYVGDLLNFLSAVFSGVHMLRIEHISRSISREKFLPLLGYHICVIALFSTIWYLVGSCFGGIHDSWPSSWSWTMLRDFMVTFPWIPTLYAGIFSTCPCLWIETLIARVDGCNSYEVDMVNLKKLIPKIMELVAQNLLVDHASECGQDIQAVNVKQLISDDEKSMIFGACLWKEISRFVMHNLNM